MSKEVTTFDNTEIENRKFHHRKNLILLEDLDIDNIAIPSMVSPGEKNYKYFILCKDDDYKIKSLQLRLPKKST